MPRSRRGHAERLACDQCSETFATIDKRKDHVREKHQQTVECHFNRNGKLHHSVSVERIDCGMFKCPQCPYTTSTPRYLRRHALSCESPQTVKDRFLGKVHRPAATLLDIGIEYNAQVGIIICAICRYALSPGPKEVAIHFKRVHKAVIATAVLVKKFEPLELSLDASLDKYLQPTKTLLDPVDGVAIHKGVRCLHCEYYSPLKATMAKHLRTSHGAITNPMTSPCMVQSIYGGARIKYFGVDSRIEGCPSGSAESEAAVRRALSDYAHVRSDVAPSDDRLVSPFLRRMKWHEVVKKHCTPNITTVIASITFDPDHDVVKRVHPVVRRYWEIAQSIIGTHDYLFERMFSSTGKDIDPLSKLGRIQSSGEAYCKTMTSLLLMIHVHAKPGVIIAGDIDTSRLADRSEALRNSRTVGINDADSVEEVSVCQLKLLDQLLADIFRINLNAEHSPSDFHSFPTHRFLVCASVNGTTRDASGFVQFKQPGQITRLVAILKCWARLAALMNLHQQSWGVEADASNDATWNRANALSYYLKTGYRTPFNLLQEIMSFGSSIAMAPEQRRVPQIVWLGNSYDTLLVEGHRVSLPTVIGVKKKLITKFCQSLRERVLVGFDLSSVEGLIKSDEQCFFDDYSDYSCGYSFLEDGRNPWKAMSMDLVKYLLHAHFSKFITQISDGKPVFGLATLSAWCKEVDRLTKLLAPLIFITSGQPSRAAELSATTVRNTVSGERSVYMVDTDVMIVQRYHKGLAMSGQHRLIARFLPRELTLDFIVYMALVRPAYDFFLSVLKHGERCTRELKDGNSSLYYLFSTVENGRLTGKGCRAAINMEFLNCGTQLSVRSYRHVAIAFMEKKVRSTKSGQDMFDFQAAHAPITASNLYSRSTKDPYFMSRDDMAEFRSCSDQWHQLLDVGDVTAIEKRSLPTVTQQEPTTQLDSSAGSHAVCNPVACEPRERVVTIVTPTQRYLTIHEATNCLLPDQFASAHQQLQRFLREPSAQFRSPEQCIASTLILQSVANLLVVLATNGGKSLLYQLSSFCDSSRVVVVVVPLVALLMDSLRKTKALGIQCSEYDQEMSPHTALPSVLFVGVNYLEQPRFRVYISSLREQNKISRIFFDEAHLALTSQSYRSCMSSVYFLSTIPVQKTLLSATLPPTWETELATTFGFHFATVRTKTTRSSIRYEVKEVLSESAMDKFCLEIVRISLDHPNKGIVFAMTKPKVEEVAAFLSGRTGWHIARYHSGMTIEERRENLENWKSASCSFIVATCGFGQGVDYPNVRTVIHYGLAHNLIDYAQETGRSGRDGEKATCITIYSDSYYQRSLKFLMKSSPNHHGDIQALREFRDFVVDKKRCRRQRLQEAMDGVSYPCTLDVSNHMCDVCSGAATTTDTRSLIVPASRGIEIDGIAATAKIVSDQKVYLVLQQSLFDDSSEYCAVCWVANPSAYEYHLPAMCPHQAMRCFNCLGEDHDAQSCLNSLKFGTTRSCYFCGIPYENVLVRNSLHFGSKVGASCRSRLRGKMIPGVWKFYNDCKARQCPSAGLESEICRLTRLGFSEWLVQIRTGRCFTNLCILWSYILTRYSA